MTIQVLEDARQSPRTLASLPNVVRPIDLLRSLPANRPMSGIEKAERRAERMERNGSESLQGEWP